MRLSFIVDLVHAQKSKLVRVPVSQLLKVALYLQGVWRHHASLQAFTKVSLQAFTSFDEVACMNRPAACAAMSQSKQETRCRCASHKSYTSHRFERSQAQRDCSKQASNR